MPLLHQFGVFHYNSLSLITTTNTSATQKFPIGSNSFDFKFRTLLGRNLVIHAAQNYNYICLCPLSILTLLNKSLIASDHLGFPSSRNVKVHLTLKVFYSYLNLIQEKYIYL